MIEVMKDLPPFVAAFKASGKVSKEDYEKILIPKVDKVALQYKKVNFLLCLETGVRNYTAGAWIDDLMVGIKHFTHWHKIAIVSHQGTIKKITDIFGHLIPGETRGFSSEDLAAAIAWISEP